MSYVIVAVVFVVLGAGSAYAFRGYIERKKQAASNALKNAAAVVEKNV